MQPWFDEQPDRHAWELAELRARGFAPSVDEELLRAGVLVLTVQVELGDKSTTPVRIYYPPGFPSAAPQIAAPGITLPAHQTPWVSALCVLAGQRQWRADGSAAALLAEAIALLKASFADPDRVRREEVSAPEPASFYLLNHPNMAVVVPLQMQDSSGLKDGWGLFEARQVTPNLLVINKATRSPRGANEPLVASADILKASRKETDQIHGAWFWLDEHPPYPLPGGSYDDALRSQYTGLLNALSARYPDALARVRSQGRSGQEWLAVVYPDESGTRGEFIAGWLLVRIVREKRGERFTFYRPMYWNARGASTGSPASGGLLDKSIVIVGLGAIGSTVAVELAKAGIRELSLFDPDWLTPSNLVRHEAGFFELGLSKAVAVSRRIVEQAPWTEVHVDTDRVGAGDLTNPVRAWEDHKRFVEVVRAASLVVDTTADPQASAVLNELCVRNRIPLVIGWATGGAWGGRIIRVRPFVSACYECVGWSQHLDGGPTPPHDPAAIRYPEGCAHPSFGGAGFETKMIALAITRVVSATLSDGPMFPDFPGDHYVLSLRDAASQRERMWLPLSTPRSSRCGTCGSGLATDHDAAFAKAPLLNT